MNESKNNSCWLFHKNKLWNGRCKIIITHGNYSDMEWRDLEKSHGKELIVDIVIAYLVCILLDKFLERNSVSFKAVKAPSKNLVALLGCSILSNLGTSVLLITSITSIFWLFRQYKESHKKSGIVFPARTFPDNGKPPETVSPRCLEILHYSDNRRLSQQIRS